VLRGCWQIGAIAARAPQRWNATRDRAHDAEAARWTPSAITQGKDHRETGADFAPIHIARINGQKPDAPVTFQNRSFDFTSRLFRFSDRCRGF